MTLRILGRPIYTADNSVSAPGVSQKVKLAANLLVKSFRVGVSHYNNPIYTTIDLKIYGNRNGFLGKLLHTSTNTITKEIIAVTEIHTLKETFFEFSSAPALRAGEEYFIALFINGAYVGDSAKHLAWNNTWPDPIFDTGVIQTQAKAAKYPLSTAIIGCTLP